MRSQKALITMLRGLVKLLGEEADRNPQFAAELEALLSPLSNNKPGRKQVTAVTEPTDLPDIHAEFASKGEAEFSLWLCNQPIGILRALIRRHDLDATRRTAKWKNTEQLSSFITDQIRSRRARGSGFLITGNRG